MTYKGSTSCDGNPLHSVPNKLKQDQGLHFDLMSARSSDDFEFNDALSVSRPALLSSLICHEVPQHERTEAKVVRHSEFFLPQKKND